MNELLNNMLGAVLFVGFFAIAAVEALKRTEVFGKRTLPVVSLALGMFVGFIIAIGFNQDVPTYVAAGFVGGIFASGLYDAVKSSFVLLKDLFNLLGGK